MFLTIQFPFVDLRPFLSDSPTFVPHRLGFTEDSTRVDLKRLVSKHGFVRHFGPLRLRGYVPQFQDEVPSTKSPPEWSQQDEGQWTDLAGIWQEEYLYASAQRGLRFEGIEKYSLIGGKLDIPRVKIRALRFSPLNPSDPMWSPSLRVELGMLYTAKEMIGEDELNDALAEFVRLKVRVPTVSRDGAGKNAIAKNDALAEFVRLKVRVPTVSRDGADKTAIAKKAIMAINAAGSLIDQKEALAELIVMATAEQHILKLHKHMIVPGEPLITVHYYPHELAGLPDKAVKLPKIAEYGCSIGYLPLRKYRIGAWLFGMPRADVKPSRTAMRRVSIRNHTVAILRYWSELQAMLGLREALLAGEFKFAEDGIELMERYVNRTTRFLLSDHAYGAQLGVIRNAMSAYTRAMPDSLRDANDTLVRFGRHAGKKLAALANGKVKVFVSYSHRDGKYLPIIREALSPYLESAEVVYFDDTQLAPGDPWEQVLIQRLEEASVIVVLVSGYFLKSDYVTHVEWPRMVKRYQQGQARIIPILVRGKIPKHGDLSSIQFINPRRPLSRSTPDQLKVLSGRLHALVGD